ncbi:hypothetical protein [Natranaeroarchaeum aerophilus]|uniref:Uncharacterized protein n=1 Tax=Natranaeroarchaeum aerophilus TaxID=2917711 RepID=A0AAE3FM59_9EURY|nr:hypothetical protein [Natranaeroarchaeum aerophilus]MCL9812267.1 hypothetical protein [Natranaeroarchaeum aerophilus]
MTRLDRRPSSWSSSVSLAMAYVVRGPYVGLFFVLLAGWAFQWFGTMMIAGGTALPEALFGAALVVAGGFLLFAALVATAYTVVRDAVAAAETQEP